MLFGFTVLPALLARSLVAGAACLATLAHAAPPTELDALTWTEVRDRIAAGSTTILIPIGGTEQNGPHMALGKHNVRARSLANAIARRLGNALVAPVVSYVPEGAPTPPAGHMRYPGTISIPDAAFDALLDGAARSFRQHGFRTIVLLGDHGGYQSNMRKVAARLQRAWTGTAIRVIALDAYYEASQGPYNALLQRQGYSAAEIGTHAGLADTALALALDPSLVRADQQRRPRATGAPADGVSGDPRRATAALGLAGIDLIVERSVAAIAAATASPH